MSQFTCFVWAPFVLAGSHFSQHDAHEAHWNPRSDCIDRVGAFESLFDVQYHTTYTQTAEACHARGGCEMRKLVCPTPWLFHWACVDYGLSARLGLT